MTSEVNIGQTPEEDQAKASWLMRLVQQTNLALQEAREYASGKLTGIPDYIRGSQRKQNDVVRDGAWLMCARRDTSEPAGVVPTGSPWWVFEGTNAMTEVLAKKILYGNRYTVTADGYFSAVRVDSSIGENYRVYLIEDPLGEKIITELFSFAAEADGWIRYGITAKLMTTGQVLDVGAVISKPEAVVTAWSSAWDYSTPQNLKTPSAGEIIHANTTTNALAIHHVDFSGTNHQGALEDLLVGDNIHIEGILFAIQDITQNATWVNFGVAPYAQVPKDDVKTVTFQTLPDVPIRYASSADWWTNEGVTNVNGIFALNGGYDSITVNGTAYGVDVEIQRAYVPTDWWPMSYSSELASQTPTILPGQTRGFNSGFDGGFK